MISNKTTEAIDKFTTSVKRSLQANAKDLRMNMTDANLLMTEIANILARLVVHENAATREQTVQETSSNGMDGGKFNR